MGLKDLHLLARDDRAAYATDQLLRLAAEHHARDDLDPSWAVGLLEHGPSRYTLSRQGSNGSSEGRGGSRKSSKLADFRVISHSSSVFMRVSAPPFKEIAVNKAELTSALAMRTKMSKADATRTVEALFDDKGIIASELKKGSKVQITGFGNFEARKRAARMGRNPKTGGVIQIKASIAPAFRAGKQLKMAVNNKK